MSPAAEAGWVGLFVTMLNLLPTGQLDGGHIAYALFGTKQERYSKMVRAALPVLFLFNFVRYFWPASRNGLRYAFGTATSASALWLGWFFVLSVMARMAGGEHPPTDAHELSPGRRAIAVLSLLLFVLIFMPTPWRQY